jgi:hypothetical protein
MRRQVARKAGVDALLTALLYSRLVAFQAVGFRFERGRSVILIERRSQSKQI